MRRTVDEDRGRHRIATYRISVSRSISAPPERLHSIIADYEYGHRLILPKPPFVSMTVVRGGFGAGTEIELAMRIMGRLVTYRGVVSEPEAGRVISERYLDTRIVTSFTVDPREEGRAAVVTIATDMEVGTGLAAAIRRSLASRMLRPVYVKELELLAALACGRP